MDPPPFFTAMCAYLALDDGLTARWWQALSLATTPLVAQWTQRQVRFAERRGVVSDVDLLAFRRITFAPQTMVELLEALVDEQQLSRHDSTAIEEAIFARLDRHGSWASSQRKETPYV